MTETDGRGGGLLIRLWTEPGEPGRVRARLLGFTAGEEPVPWATAADRAALERELHGWVRDWLDRYSAAAGPADQRP